MPAHRLSEIVTHLVSVPFLEPKVLLLVDKYRLDLEKDFLQHRNNMQSLVMIRIKIPSPF